MFLTKKSICTTALLCAITINAFSQTLDSISGKVKTIYSSGYKTRAQTIQKLITGAETFYEKNYPSLKFSVRLNVLAKDDWEKQIKIPYGIPYCRQNNIYVGADKKYIASLFHTEDLTGDDKPAPVDALALHELGHNFFLTVTNTETQFKWMDEFLSSYFMIAYTRQANINAVLPGMGPYVPQHRSLAEFEKIYLGVGPQNYDWYQRQFLKLGYALYPKLKLKLIDAFLANYVDGGKKTDPLLLLKSLDTATVNAWLAEMDK